MAELHKLLIARLDACTKHARELVSSARAVLTLGQHNVAYHLAVLALEEIGKRELILLESMNAETMEVPAAWPAKHQLDHQQKLFWCFFGGSMFRHSIRKDDFEGARNLSRTLHMKRLSALYVDVSPDGVSIPSLAVTPEETEDVLKFAEIRVEMAESQKPRDVAESERENQRWFLKMTEDMEQRKIIFSKASMDKLAELDDAPAWVEWLKEQFEKSRQKGQEAVAAEIERGKYAPKVGTKPKWRVRLRIRSASHSIRPSVLKDWNNTVNMVKLSPVSGSGGSKKRELIVELILNDHVPIQGLYHLAWGVARHFVVALNIATLGFWWWGFSEYQETWFERIEDIEKPDFHLNIERPDRKIDWGERRVLTDDDIRRLKLTFAALPMPGADRKYGPLDAYVAGLTMLAASDVHLPLEVDAFGHFLQSLRLMMIEAGELKDGDPIEPAFVSFVNNRHPEFPEREEMLAIIRAYDDSLKGTPGKGPRLKPEHVSLIKLFVDWYFLDKLQSPALKRLEAEGIEGGVTVAAQPHPSPHAS